MDSNKLDSNSRSQSGVRLDIETAKDSRIITLVIGGGSAETKIVKLVGSEAITASIDILKGAKEDDIDNHNYRVALDFLERELSSKDPVVKDELINIKKLRKKLERVREEYYAAKIDSDARSRLENEIADLKKDVKEASNRLEARIDKPRDSLEGGDSLAPLAEVDSPVVNPLPLALSSVPRGGSLDSMMRKHTHFGQQEDIELPETLTQTLEKKVGIFLSDQMSLLNAHEIKDSTLNNFVFHFDEQVSPSELNRYICLLTRAINLSIGMPKEDYLSLRNRVSDLEKANPSRLNFNDFKKMLVGLEAKVASIGVTRDEIEQDRITTVSEEGHDPFNESVRGLLAYIQLLFDAWVDASQGWDVNHPQRQRLKSLEQVALPFWLSYKKQLSTPDKPWLFNETTLADYSKVLSEYKKYGKKLAETTIETFVIKEQPILNNDGVLPEPLPTTALKEESHCWHEKVHKDELDVLWESAQHRGQLILPTTVADKVHHEARKAHWQRIGGRLLARAKGEEATEKAWCWLLSAFLSEGYHRQTIESWACWIELLGRAAQQSLCHKRREPVPPWRALNWTSIDGDYLQYRSCLADYRRMLAETFKAHYNSQKSIVESRAELSKALITWQDNLYSLVGAMFYDALVLLGEPSVPYCFMLTGSLSRNSAVAYSDVEMALLVDDPILVNVLHGLLAKDVNVLSQASDEHQETALHLLHLLRLVRFHLASLGEEGVVLDESGDPLRETCLIGTAESFLKDVQAECNKEQGWPYSLLHVQESRSYSNAAGKALLARYKEKIGNFFTGITVAENAWQPSQWLLNHQKNNARNFQRKEEDNFDIKTHGLKPLTFLIIDLAGLAGVGMDSVPQALKELAEGSYLAPAMGLALSSTWEGLLQWRCHHQLTQEGPIDFVKYLATLSAHENHLKVCVTVILERFYEQLPLLTALLNPDDKVLSFSEQQNVLRDQLQVWTLTVALHHHVNSGMADAFAKLSAALIPKDREIYENFQNTGQSEWEESWHITIARGLYGLLNHEDRNLREELLTALMNDLSLEAEESSLASKAMQMYLMREMYPILFTYWIEADSVVPKLTDCLMRLMGILMKMKQWEPYLPKSLEQPRQWDVNDEAKTSLATLLNRLWQREKPYVELYDSYCRDRLITWLLGYGVCDTQPSTESYRSWVLQCMTEGNRPLTVLSLLQAGAGKQIAHCQGFRQAYDYFTCQRIQKRPVPSEQAWKDAQADLEKSNRGFFWFVFVRNVLELPMEEGGFPLMSHDGSFEARPYFYTLPAAVVDQLFTREGTPIDKNHHGRRQVGEMVYEGYHAHGKFFPELPGVEEAVRVFSEQLQLGGVAMSQLFRCPYSISKPQRDPKKQAHLSSADILGFPLLLSLHVEGENVQDGLSENPVLMEKRLSQLHRGHFTRLLLLTLLIHPEDGQPANFILSTTEPDKKGNCYKLVSVDNDHAFVAPWVKVDKNDVQMQIKTLVYCVEAMGQPLEMEVLQEFIVHIIRLSSTNVRQKDHSTKVTVSERVTVVISQWLKALDKRYDAYYHLFTEKERKYLKKTHKKPYRLPLSQGQQQDDAITPLLQLTPQDVGGVYERLERLLEVLSTIEDLSILTGLSLLRRVSPLVYPCYEVLHQRYDTVQARFQHIGAKQYEETVEIDPQTNQSQISYSSCRTSTLLLQQRGIPDKALVTGMAFRPNELLRRLSDFSAVHYQQIGRQLTSTRHNTMKKGEKAYYGLLLDSQRGAVLRSIKNPSVSQQRRLLSYWNGLVVDTLSLLKFSLLDDTLLKRVLQNKPLLNTLHITDSEGLTEKGLERIGRYAPVLHTLVLKRCKRLNRWPQWRVSTSLLFVTNKHIIFPQLQTLYVEACPITYLPLLMPKLTTLHVKKCPNLEGIGLEGVGIYSLDNTFRALTLKELPSLSSHSFRHLLHYTKIQTRLAVKGLSSVKTPARTRALLKVLWEVDPEAYHVRVGMLLVDLLVRPWLKLGESDEGIHGIHLPLLELDLRGLPLSCAWVSLLIERYSNNGIQRWQWPTLPAGSEGQLLAFTACQAVQEITVQFASFLGLGEKGGASLTVLEGHTDWVRALEVLVDGRVMSGSDDRSLRYWVQRGSGEWICESILKGHASAVTALKMLMDGSVMSSSWDTTLRHWVRGSDGEWVCISVLESHTAAVYTLKVLSDGGVMSGSHDRTLRYWVREKDGGWVCASVLKGHTASVSVLQVLPDGSVLSGSWDATLRHWARGSDGEWACESILEGHTAAVNALEVLSDGSVLSGSSDRTLRYWIRGNDGKWMCASVMEEGHTLGVNALQLLPDGSVLSGSDDSTLCHWVRKDEKKWKCISQLQGGHTGSVKTLQLLLDGSVMSGSSDATLRHWSRSSLAVSIPLKTLADLIQSVSHPLPIKVEWQEGKVIVDTLWAWEKTFQETTERREGMAVTLGDNIEARKALISSLGETLRAVLKALAMINDTSSEAAVGYTPITIPFIVEETDGFPIVIKSKQREELLGFMEGLLRGLKPDAVSIKSPLGVDESQVALLLERTHQLTCVSVDHPLSFPCRQRLIKSQPYLTTLQWREPDSASIISVLQGHSDGVSALVVLPDGNVLSGSRDATLRHWVRGGERGWICESVLEGHTDCVYVLAMLLDGSVLSGSYDKSFRHWVRGSDGAWGCISVLEGHSDGVSALAVLPDGSVLIGSRDATLRHWIRGGDGEWACGSVLEGHAYGVTALAVLPDGSVLSGSADATLCHWVRRDDGEWACGSVLSRHKGLVSALKVLPDGSVLSGSWDKTLRHWVRGSDGKWACKSILSGHRGLVSALEVLADGSVVSGSWDKTLRHWVCGSKGDWVCVSVLEGHTDWVTDLVVLPDGSVVSGSWDKILRHWSLPLQYSLFLPTVADIKKLWLSTASSKKRIVGQSLSPVSWPKNLWTCTIFSSQQLVMTVHHTYSLEWLTAIKAIGVEIFKGMAGCRVHTITETYATVTCTFQVSPKLDYFDEIQSTFEALHQRIEKGWSTSCIENAAVGRVEEGSLVKSFQQKEKLSKRSGRSIQVKASASFHNDSPLSSATTSKLNNQRSQQDLSLTITTARSYVTKGDELMQNDAIEEALVQYEAGLSYLHSLSFDERSVEETALYNTLTGRIAGVKSLLTQATQQGVEKSMPLSG
ncbi:MAG: WD40 repeat domain-containing protein [Gammaproteobacteria bacterium]